MKLKYRAPIRNLNWPAEEPKYWLQGWTYFSVRHGKAKTVPDRFWSDGATCAPDHRSMGWQVHDVICEIPRWDDGTPIYPWQAALVLHDIMHEEGLHLLDALWAAGTMTFGCRKTWNNVWLKLRKVAG